LKPNLEVRQFQPSDLDRVLSIEQASFGSDAWDKKLFLAYHRKCADLFLIASASSRVAGYSITCAGSRNAELVSIAVDPRYRRRGIAQALLDQTLAEMRSRRVKTCWLMVETVNEPAVRFYEKHGFTRAKIVRRYYGAGRDAWRMQSKLV
jgi:[ribosomal protein S18]-alanine N-acetyltransferase